MGDNMTIQEQFENELNEAIRAVCRKYRASIALVDDGKSYGMQSPILEVGFASDGPYICHRITWLNINEEHPSTP